VFWQHWTAAGCGTRDMVQEQLDNKGEASQGGVKTRRENKTGNDQKYGALPK
jgi:hypothetical protein